ncbi:MAG: SpoIIE family protein phosphatase, partial [Clostridia bacterium]|nr:SpoIIE family protein phosphatase [Clostridia bacterium]
MQAINTLSINSCDFVFNILENMQDMVRVVDKEDNVVFVNKIMREKLGNFIGKKCYELAGRNRKCMDCISEKSIEYCKPFEKEEEFNSNIYSVVSSPVFNENNQKYYAVEVFRDITEQKNMEKKIFDQYKKMKKDLDFAKQVQSQIIPNDSVYGECIKITSIYQPSELLGGDIFDVIEIDDENIGFYIADIAGHGVSASLFTMFLRQTMRNQKNKILSMEETINELIKNYKELNLDKETYMTLLYGTYNKKNREITFVNAGHNCFPTIIRKNKSVEEITITGLPICSLVDHFSHDCVTVKVEKGDQILLYTDGIIEGYNSEKDQYYGYKNFRRSIEENIQHHGESFIDSIYN